MRVLVLGGTGYLGAKVVKRLVLQSSVDEIVCARRGSSIPDKLKDVNIRWIGASVDDIKREIDKNRIDIIINMACNYGRNGACDDEVLSTNFLYPMSVLECSLQQNEVTFITMGTGLPNDFNMYSFSKYLLGTYGKYCVKKDNLSFYNLLLEMFYGEDEPKERFIPYLIDGMKTGETINTTYGTQKRDIIYVENVVDAIVKITCMEHKKGYYEYPIGTGYAPRICDVVNYIWERTNKKSKINYGAIKMRDDEPDCIADIEPIAGIMKWEPVNWREGIDLLIESREGI